MRLPRVTELAHAWIQPRVRAGSVAIDATAGNGHDTLFLANLVGDEGRVHAFDIQAAALEETGRRLEANGVHHRVELHAAGHEGIAETMAGERGRVSAILFNLGYLPGADHEVTTEVDTTRLALEGALALMAPEGVLTVVCYLGHPGGPEESAAVVAQLSELNPAAFRVVRYETLNADRAAPFLIGVERLV